VAPDALFTRAPEVWCTAVELATLSDEDAYVRAYRHWAEAVKAWLGDHDGRYPWADTTAEQRRAARLRAVDAAR
jgi:hypothetical protein